MRPVLQCRVEAIGSARQEGTGPFGLVAEPNVARTFSNHARSRSQRTADDCQEVLSIGMGKGDTTVTHRRGREGLIRWNADGAGKRANHLSFDRRKKCSKQLLQRFDFGFGRSGKRKSFAVGLYRAEEKLPIPWRQRKANAFRIFGMNSRLWSVL